MSLTRSLACGLAASSLLTLAGCGAGANSEAGKAAAAAATTYGEQVASGNLPEAPMLELYNAVETAVATGTAIELETVVHDSLRGNDAVGTEKTKRKFILKHSDLIAPDAFFEINGTPAPWPFVRVYEGHVEGAPEQIAHLMIASDYARGGVRIPDASDPRAEAGLADRMHLFRYNMKRNRPATMPRRPEAPAEHATDKPPRSPEPSGCPTDTYGNVAELRAVPPYNQPTYSNPGQVAGMNAGPVLKSRIILDSDYKALELWGTKHMSTMGIGMTIEADITYRDQVDIRHQIVGVHENRLKTFYPNTIDVDPFAEMGIWWDNHHTERDIVHLFSGYDTGYAQANCIGSVGTLAGYSFSPIVWEDQNGWFHQNVLAHEWGHIYSAHHHYGNHAESDVASIMIQGYTPGSQPNFGSLEKTTIRGWAEEYLKPWE